MVSSAELQNAYNNLYIEVRKYFWSYQAVCALADLEIATYKACPDLDEIRHALNTFKIFTREVLPEDEDLEVAFDDFDELLDEDSTYTILDRVNEVIQQ